MMKHVKVLFSGLVLLCGIAFFYQSSANENVVVRTAEVAVVYANLSCTMPDGTDGCECTITSSDDDCSLQTACASSSNFVNYNTVLNAMFSPSDIAARAAAGTRITESPLKEALISDGFPLKEQMNKFSLLILVFCVQCSNTEHFFDQTSYRLTVHPVSCEKTSVKNISVILEQEDRAILCSYNNNYLSFIDIASDTIIRRISIPYQLDEVHSISMSDTANGVIFGDSCFVKYNTGNFDQIFIDEFKENPIVIGRHNIIYFKELDMVACAVYHRHVPVNLAPYERPIIDKFYLETKTTSSIDFTYPKQYVGNRLGIPKFYFSSYENTLVASFGLDERVFTIDMETDKVQSIVLKSRHSSMDAAYPKDGTKEEKVNALQANSAFKDRYGIAYYDPTSGTYFRNYFPASPIQDSHGAYISSQDKGCVLLFSDGQGPTTEIKLPHGVYYMEDDWYLSKGAYQLTYNKITDFNHDGNWEFYIHTLYLYGIGTMQN